MIDKVRETVKKKEIELEALRGFAAIIVVVSHLINYRKFLDPNYFPQRFFNVYDGGHLMVLIFFVLSGFVIAISNKKKLTSAAISGYVKKRIVRIYPIYFISILAALVIGTTTYSFSTIISNLTFANVFFSNVMLDNGPIWSLHYEVLFYILFIPLSFFNIKLVPVAMSAVVIGLLNFFYASYINLLSLTSYCFGFTFWISGVIIARYFIQKEYAVVNYRKLVSYLFLLLTIPYLNFFAIVMERLSLDYYGGLVEFPYDGIVSHWFKIAFRFLDFSFLPYCIVGVLLFINSKFKYSRAIIFILQVLPGYAIYYYIMHHSKVNFTVPYFCYLISWMLFFDLKIFNRISASCIKGLSWLGSISYAVYIFHIPILYFFNRVNRFSGSRFTYITRLFFYVGVTILVSYLIEKYFQLWIRNNLRRRKALISGKFDSIIR